MRARRVPWGRWGRAAAAAVTALGSACTPWTVRPLEEGTAAGSAMTTPVSPERYVDVNWDTTVMPAVVARAVDLASILKGGPDSTSLFVRGTARVVQVDTRSRAGLAHLDLLPADGHIDAALQIGPVLRGTALRDALGLSFGAFVNQIDFAAVATALNDRALRSALQGAAPETLSGRTVSFVGAVRTGAARGARLEILPVVLTVEERAR